jgi:hypothetical protein
LAVNNELPIEGKHIFVLYKNKYVDIFNSRARADMERGMQTSLPGK